MKRNETEKRIFEEAEKLTPEPPSFAEATKNIDWELVAKECKPDKSKHRWVIPAGISTAACSIAVIALSLAISASINGAGSEERAILYGSFEAVDWECSDPSITFSDSVLYVQLGASTPSVTPDISIPTDAFAQPAGIAYLADREGRFHSQVSFAGQFLSSLQFGALKPDGAPYRGLAKFVDETLPFTITFPSAKDPDKKINVSFGDYGTSVYGSVYFEKPQ